MTVTSTLTSQYQAGLQMLANCIQACPDQLWANQHPHNRFWHIAFHTLFYTHLYLADSENDFEAWEKHIEQYEYLSFRSEQKPTDTAVYSQAELLDYHALCYQQLEPAMVRVDLEAPSGFSWLPFNKLELHLYNLRHLQHHTGQLGDRLRESEGIAVPWIGKGES